MYYWNDSKEVELIKVELNLNKDINENKIENFWNIFSYGWNHIKDIISILKNKSCPFNKEIFSFTIIASLNVITDTQKNQINELFQNIENSKIREHHYPFIIFLIKNVAEEIILKEEIKKCKKFDERNISCFISPLLESPLKEQNKKLIKQKINKIFSYFYELGDEFEFGTQKIKLYEEPEEGLLPVNVLVIGKTQVGKSTVINTFLNEKRSKEGSNGFSVTKRTTTYHIDKIPLLIKDIEGFTGEKNIDYVVKEINNMQVSFQEKELHLTIYVLRYEGGTYFNANEYKIFEQLSKVNHQSHFLFICTRAGDDQENAFADIIESFYEMVKKGLEKECKEEQSKFIYTLNYLYFCQKKDIHYNEIDNKIEEEIFNSMDFYQKMELKFSGKTESEKYEEMVNTIIEKDKNLIFVNLKKEKGHKILFGMDKISTQIINVLKEMKEFNMKILDDELKHTEYNINGVNNELTKNPIFEEDRKRLLEESEQLKGVKNDFTKLKQTINEDRRHECRDIAEKIRNNLFEQLNKDLISDKFLGYLSGVVPLFDIGFQHLIKENAKKKIAKKFSDSLEDLNKIDSSLSKDEKDDVEEVKEKTNDVKSDILKSIGRVFYIGFRLLKNISNIALALPGIALGVAVGGIVTQYDINKFVEFYGKRFVYRCLIVFSFKKIERYLNDNFGKKQ